MYVYKYILFDLPFYTSYISTQEIFGYEFRAEKRTSRSASVVRRNYIPDGTGCLIRARRLLTVIGGEGKNKIGGRRHARIIKKVYPF